jgi:predicted Zn-dependent peptidase
MKYTKKTLSNGLRVITVPMPQVKSVTALIMVGVGSRYEDKKINGLSHFLEHMAFKGTEKRPTALAISSEIDGIGGECNAFTSKDHTGFYIKSASKHLPLLVDILSDMLLHSKFDATEIEKEKGVIIEEINMYEDMPIRKIGDIYENLMYGDTKLGRDIAGTEKVIKSIKRDDFIDYVGRFYHPKNTVIGIAGGIDGISEVDNQVSVEKLIEKYLGGWKTKTSEEFEKVDDTQDKPALLVRFKDTQQAHLCLGFRTFKINHPDKYKMEVLSAIMGGGMSSRLFIQVREKRGLAYYVRSGMENYQDVGNFATQAGVDVERIDKAIEVILEEFAKLKKTGVEKKELNKAKEYIKGRFTLDLEDSRSVASLFTDAELLEGRIRTPSEIEAGVDAVNEKDIQEMANKYLLEKTLNLAIIGPYKNENRFKKLLKL